jgi:hypothetical protein
MSSIRLRLEAVQGLLWPKVCMVCGGSATHTAMTSFTIVKDVKYFLVALGWTKQTQSIPFPVCRKHRLLCNLLDRPSKWGFVGSFLFLVFAPTFFLVAVVLIGTFIFSIKKGPTLDAFLTCSAVFSYGLVIAFFIAAWAFKPLRISELKEYSLVLSIRNKDCFRAFEALNSEKVIRQDKTEPGIISNSSYEPKGNYSRYHGIPAVEADPIDVKNRVSCSDETCIGIMGPDGRCTECGRVLNRKGY